MFDRYDILDAYYLFFTFYHEGQWSRKYERLSKMGRYYKPSMMLHNEEDLNDNAREIFANLVERENAAN